jgi:hypothetical protein
MSSKGTEVFKIAKNTFEKWVQIPTKMLGRVKIKGKLPLC